MNEQLISVIIPFYNTDHRIKKCIESLINQSYKKIEIILVNDGSTDNSLKICQETAVNDNRIKIINLPHSGVSIARNKGIDLASGEFIMFVDSDDYVDNTIVERLYNNILETGADICQCGCKVLGSDNSFIKSYSVPINGIVGEELIVMRCVLPLFGRLSTDPYVVHGFCVSKLFRRNVLNNIRFSEKQYIYQDRCFNIDAYLASKQVSFINDELYYYVINNKSNTQRLRNDLWDLCVSLFEEYSVRTSKLPICYKNEIIERIHSNASGRLVYVTRHIFLSEDKISFFKAVKKVKRMRKNAFFNKGVMPQNQSFVFCLLSKLLHYKLCLIAVLIVKLI